MIGHWWRSVRWPAIGTVGIVVFALGIVGFADHLSAGGVDVSFVDVAYRSIQLFVLEWNGIDAPLSLPLEVARLAAPLVAGLAAAQAIAVLFRDEVDRLTIRLLGHGHVVVCGYGARGSALAENLRITGTRVAVVDPQRPVVRPGRGIAWFEGDASDPVVLGHAGARRAAHLVALAPSDATNALIVRSARDIGGGDLTIHMSVRDPGLAALLRTEAVMAAGSGRPGLEFFDLEERSATRLLDVVAGEPRDILIVGCGSLARSVPVVVARRSLDGDRPAVTVLGRQSRDFVAGIRERCEGIDDAIDLRCVEQPVASVARSLDPAAVPDLIVLAMSDESVALTVALEMVQVLKGRPIDGRIPEIVLTTDRAAAVAGLVDSSLGGDAAIRLRAFDAVREVLSPDLLECGTVEQMARAIHSGYRGVLPGDGAGASIEHLPDWGVLDGEGREASRAAAAAVGGQLRAVGCDLVPTSGLRSERLVFTPAEVELIAILEHERWLAWKREHGFVPGSPRGRRRNPHMVEWFRLDDGTRDRVRAAVRRLPGVLETAGQRVIRLDRSPARALHEGYVERRLGSGDTVEGNAALVGWDRLPETLRASNRDQVAHLRVKLMSIGCDVRPGVDGGVELDEADLEGLARLEHERWRAHRVFDGWVAGPVKDVDSKVSPYLVDWADLDEEIREIDREFIRSIPDVVHAMGWHIERL